VWRVAFGRHGAIFGYAEPVFGFVGSTLIAATSIAVTSIAVTSIAVTSIAVTSS